MKYKSELNQLIEHANFLLNRKGSTHVIRLNNDHITDDDFSISPRLSAKNLVLWLNGFISGLDF
jgi:hypothetical protein